MNIKTKPAVVCLKCDRVFTPPKQDGVWRLCDNCRPIVGALYESMQIPDAFNEDSCRRVAPKYMMDQV